MSSAPAPAFDREAVLERLARRMSAFDDFTLAELDRLTDETTYLPPASKSTGVRAAPAAAPDGRGVSHRSGGPGTADAIDRRRLLAGGALAGAAATAGGLALFGGERFVRAENSRLATIIELYRQIDGLDLDGRLRQAIGLVAAAIGAARAAAGALETGVDAVGRALDVAEAALVPIRDGLGRLEILVGRLAGAFDQLSAAVAERAQPVTEAVGGLFREVLDFLPPGLAVPLRETVEAIGTLVDMVPAIVAAARDELILPLRTTWLPDPASGTPGIDAALFVPLRERVLAPGRDMVERMRAIETAWSEGAAPLEDVLAQRDGLRARIAELVG